MDRHIETDTERQRKTLSRGQPLQMDRQTQREAAADGQTDTKRQRQTLSTSQLLQMDRHRERHCPQTCCYISGQQILQLEDGAVCVFIVIADGLLVGGLALEHQAVVHTLQQHQDVFQQQHLQLDEAMAAQSPHQGAIVDQLVGRQVQFLCRPRKRSSAASDNSPAVR